MGIFHYDAKQLDGHVVSGSVMAGTEHEALAVLAKRDLFPLQVLAAPVGKRRARRASAGLLARLYRQLADLLRAGVTLTRSLELLARQARHPALVDVLPQVLHAVQDGASLADALGEHPHVFRDLAVHMVRAGEEGGFLEDALQRIGLLVERQHELQSRIRSALAYPCFLVVTGMLIVLGMLLFFVPSFTPIFQRLAQNGELPWLTQWLMTASDVLRGKSLEWGLATIVVVSGAAFTVRAAAVRRWLERQRLRVFVMGPMLRDLAVARFCRVLGTLLHNGVPLLRSLRIARDATGVEEIAAAIATATDHVTAGRSLATPLAECSHFHPDVLEIIHVGEQSNHLETVLIDVAEMLDRETQQRLDLVVRLIEPILLLLIAIVVLIMIWGLLLPAFDAAGVVS